MLSDYGTSSSFFGGIAKEEKEEKEVFTPGKLRSFAM